MRFLCVSDDNDGCILSRNETKDEVRATPLGYSTKVKLNSNSPSNFSWDNQSKFMGYIADTRVGNTQREISSFFSNFSCR